MPVKSLKAARTLSILAVLLATLTACANTLPPPPSNSPEMQGPWPAYLYPQHEGGG
jgi:hypothetical protein